MKKLFLFFLKPLSFAPALLMMYVIFNFSAQSGAVSGNLSHEISYRIVTVGNQALHKNLDEDGIKEVTANIEYPVRKLAHMSEYFLLAIAVSFPFYVYGLRGFSLLLIAGFICVGFACGDEYHQSFVAGRGPSIRDVGIDSIGVFLGVMVVRITCWTFLAPARAYERAQRRRERSCKRHPERYYEEPARRKNYFADYEEDDYYYHQAIQEKEEENYYEEAPTTPKVRPTLKKYAADDLEKELAKEIQKYMD